MRLLIAFFAAAATFAAHPTVNQPVGDVIGYHVRSGKHGVTEYDWRQYLAFAARHFGVAGGRQTNDWISTLETVPGS